MSRTITLPNFVKHELSPHMHSRLVVQHLYQVSFKSMQGCRRSCEDKLWWDGMTEWRKEGRIKQTLNAPLPFYGRGIKTPERKKRSESRDIDENNIVQCLWETFGIFRLLATERRRIALVHYVIGNMAGSNKRWRQRRSKHRKKRVLRRW